MKNTGTLKGVLKAAVLIFIIVYSTSTSMAQQPQRADSGYAPVNGIKVYYEVYGSGQPLILLHGAFMTISMNWSELIAELSKTRKVIALEMQGHGHSPYADRKMSVTAMAKDVAGVMDYLKIDSADIAGYSMGGSVAYQLVVQSPKRVKKLVIISSTYKTAGWLPVVSGAFKGFRPEFFDNTPLKTAYDAVAPDKSNWRKFILQMITMLKTPFNVGDANIAKIAAPVLLITGDNDGVDKIELAKTYRLLGGDVAADMAPMPKSQLAILPSQAHVSVMMQTTAIFSYMENFLK